MSSMGTGLRCFVASLAILSLAGHLSAVPLAAGVSCQNNNPFIKIMKDQGVELYSQPKQVSSICTHEFQTYGTCCVESQLIGFEAQDRQKLLQSHYHLGEEYFELATMAKTLLKAVHLIAKQKTSGQGQTQEPSEIKAAFVIIQSAAYSRASNLAEEMTNESIGNFNELSRVCWTALANLRSQSICSVCSGRSAHFFQNDKILVSQTKCNQLALLCAEPMKILAKLTDFLADLEALLAVIKTSGLEINLADGLDFSKLVTLRHFSSQIKTALVIAGASNLRAREIGNKKLCEVFMQIRHPPLISKIEECIKKPSRVVWGIRPDVAKLMVDKQSVYTSTEVSFIRYHASGMNYWNFGSTGRLLQFGDGQPQDSDANIIDPTDPSYSGVGVSGHGPIPDTETFP